MKRTPLYDFHVACGARMVDFAGWEMPLLYAGIVEEHTFTRQTASVFDVSHMGRIEFHGADAEGLLQRVCTRQLGDAVPGQSRYGHVCNENGGILDDVIVSRFEDHWLMVCNASNRDRIVAWLRKHSAGMDVDIQDRTESTMMVALQGPAVMDRLAGQLPIPVSDLKRYRFKTGAYLGMPYTISRSGYTGEDGFELILPASLAPLLLSLAEQMKDGSLGIKPAGLGARDTLRLEAGMPLYGHELHEEIDSLSAGLPWCVDLDKDFIGVERLREIARQGPARRLVGLELEGRRIARQGASVLIGTTEVGKVTSGTMSPTLGKSIAMAYVVSDRTEAGQKLDVAVGTSTVAGTVVSLPFYKRQS